MQITHFIGKYKDDVVYCVCSGYVSKDRGMEIVKTWILLLERWFKVLFHAVCVLCPLACAAGVSLRRCVHWREVRVTVMVDGLASPAQALNTPLNPLEIFSTVFILRSEFFICRVRNMTKG